VNADWIGAPRLRTSRTIGAQGIKTWRAFGAPSHFLCFLERKLIFITLIFCEKRGKC